MKKFGKIISLLVLIIVEGGIATLISCKNDDDNGGGGTSYTFVGPEETVSMPAIVPLEVSKSWKIGSVDVMGEKITNVSFVFNDDNSWELKGVVPSIGSGEPVVIMQGTYTEEVKAATPIALTVTKALGIFLEDMANAGNLVDATGMQATAAISAKGDEIYIDFDGGVQLPLKTTDDKKTSSEIAGKWVMPNFVFHTPLGVYKFDMKIDAYTHGTWVMYGKLNGKDIPFYEGTWEGDVKKNGAVGEVIVTLQCSSLSSGPDATLFMIDISDYEESAVIEDDGKTLKTHFYEFDECFPEGVKKVPKEQEDEIMSDPDKFREYGYQLTLKLTK